MKDSIFISDTYELSPESIKIDEKIACFNPIKDDTDYQSLLNAIIEQGQIDPIYLRGGLAIDGRHRIKVAKELGTTVKCVDLEADMSDEDAILISNNNTFTARNTSPTQKAMQVILLVKKFSFTQTKAMLNVGTKNKNDVSAAVFINDNRTYRDLYWNDLFNKKAIVIVHNKIAVYRGSSLRRIKQELLAIEGAETDKTKKIDNRTVIDYGAYLETDSAVNEFWKRFGKNSEISMEDKLRICELLNNAYSI